MRLTRSLFVVLIACSAPTVPAHAAAVGDLFVTSLSQGLIHVNPVTGDRTLISSPLRGTGPYDTFRGVAARDSSTIYVTDVGLNAVLAIDRSTGNRTVVSSATVGTGPAFGSPLSLTFDNAGNLLVLENSSSVAAVVRVDVLTGNRTVVTSADLGVGSGPGLLSPLDLVVDASGRIIVADHSSVGLVAVDPMTGVRSTLSKSTAPAVGTGTTLTQPNGIDIAADGGLIVVDIATDRILEVDPLSGDRTSLESIVQARDVAIDNEGAILYTDDSVSTLYRFVPSSGSHTALSRTNGSPGGWIGTGPSFGAGGLHGIAYVPEPASLALLIIGIVGVGVYAHARRRLQARARG
jgi:streptogramin lyase